MKRLEIMGDDGNCCAGGNFMVGVNEINVIKLETADEIIRELEWSNVEADWRGVPSYSCPSCGGKKNEGHKDGCRIAEFLGRVKE